MSNMYRTCLWSTLCLMMVASSGVWAADQLAPVQNAINMLAQRANVPAADIKVVSVEGMDWPDTSLGAPQPGMMYAQVITPGYKVVLQAGERRYEYHTDMNQRAVLASLDGAKVTQAEAAPPNQPAPPPQSVQQCSDDLAKRLGIASDQVKLARCKDVSFPDAALGLPQPGMMYAQVITPGYIVILEAKNAQYLYAAAGQTCRYGGPLAAWGGSALYLEPRENDPDLNGNLVQVSLVGTNPALVLGRVSDFRPQHDGSIIATRRTSRSGFDLLYVAPDKRGEGTKLASASELGDAAVNDDGTRWVAFTRHGFGVPWQASWDTVAGGGKTPGHVDLPGGARPGRMYWHMTHPVAALREGEGTVYYELILTGATPQWRKLQGFFPPPTEEFMLNKSATLVVKTAQENGQPVTRVINQWFTGDERPVATIANFTPTEMSLTPNKRFLFLSGKRDDKALALTVDLATGEVLETVKEMRGPARLLLALPQAWIISQIAPAQ